MKTPVLLRSAAFGVVCLASLSSGINAETVPLRYQTDRDWDAILPKAEARKLSGDLTFAFTKTRFKTEVDGTAIQVDRDGDGSLDVKISGDSGVVTFNGSEGFHCALRLTNQGGGWEASVTGAFVGEIDGQQVRVIDQNLNGRYNDVGEDAFIVGRGKYAGYLSEIVNVRGKLYTVAVSENGGSLDYTPFDGQAGTLDLTTGFATKGKLLSAVVRSEDGRRSFVLSGGPMVVPTGNYVLDQGQLGLGRSIVNFSRGNSAAMVVASSETTLVALGEPIDIDFEYVRQPGRVIMAPQLMSYRGQAGERYETWTPFGGSPQFDVRDVETGKQLALAVFGGC